MAGVTEERMGQEILPNLEDQVETSRYYSSSSTSVTSSGTLRFIIVAATVIGTSGAGYIAGNAGQVVLVVLMGSIAITALIYGVQLWLDWRVDRRDQVTVRRDQIRFQREGHYAEMLQIDTSTQVAIMDAGTRRIAELKMDSDGRQSIILEGNYLPIAAQIVAAARNHPMPDNVPHSIHIEVAESNAGAPGQALSSSAKQLMSPGTVTNLANQITFNTDSFAFGIEQTTGLADILTIPDSSHIAVVARSKMGKSNLVDILTSTILAKNSADRVKLACLDFEGLTSKPFKPYADIYADEPEDILLALETLYESYQKRRAMAKRGELDTENLYATGHARYLIVIEEAADLIKMQYPNKQEKARVMEILCSLACGARKYGFTLLCSTQSMAGGGELAIFKGQYNMRIAGAADRQFLISSMNFSWDEELKRVCSEGRRGQFARQIAGTTSVIEVPKFNALELPALLAHRSSTKRPATNGANALNLDNDLVVEPSNDTREGRSVIELSSYLKPSQSVRPTEAPEVKPDSQNKSEQPTRPNLLNQALSEKQKKILDAYGQGVRGVRNLEKATGIHKSIVSAILDGLRLAGYVLDEVRTPDDEGVRTE